MAESPKSRLTRKRRRIAVCLAGFSPAVVTETLYALAVARRPRIVPERVSILTTEDAYGAVVSTLPGSNGAIRRLSKEYRLPEWSLHCSVDDITLLRSRSGRPLSDIRTNRDSEDAGETISRILARMHEDPDVELHCSLAGGRKTMGALLALALQLCARPGDRLYHVLVNEPFEKIPEFFYPPRRPQYYTADGRRVSSTRARIDLAEIPLIRLGVVAENLGLGREELAKRARQIEEVMARAFKPPQLQVNPDRRTFKVNSAETRLPFQEFVLYSFYVWLRMRCEACSRYRANGCRVCQPTDSEIFQSFRDRLLGCYRRLRGEGGGRLVQLLSDQSGSGRARQDFDEWLRQARSRINSRLRNEQDYSLFRESLLILPSQAPDLRKDHRHGVRLFPDSIYFVDVGESGSGLTRVPRERGGPCE